MSMTATMEPRTGRLAAPGSSVEPKSRRRWVWVLAGAGVVAAAAAGWMTLSPAPAPTYSTVVVKRADLRRTISATGKVQARTTVQVGTQVSGIVAELHADFNDRVKAGQLIARIDPSQVQAQLDQARASEAGVRASVNSVQQSVYSADASVISAQANVSRAQAAEGLARRNLDLDRRLLQEGAVPARQIDTDEAALAQAEASTQQARAQLDQAKAQAQAARSQLEQARSSLAQAQASVQVATVNLDRTFIKAPIDGVVVARNVDVGQTVAASLQAPVLFLIANDLTKMQVLADVDEADVGQLQAGAPVTFTVDAFPNDTFRGNVAQVRLSPQVLQNVVTYTAVIDVNNPDLKLKPGMTASITATVEEQKDALAVPNAALRFRPSKTPTVWKVTGGILEPVRVRAGVDSGTHTAVTGLEEGDKVAIPAVAMPTQGAARPAQSPFSGGGGGRPRGGIR